MNLKIQVLNLLEHITLRERLLNIFTIDLKTSKIVSLSLKHYVILNHVELIVFMIKNNNFSISQVKTKEFYFIIKCSLH